ncbi:MAG: biotin--[acetyl-CoA-carboxylase] ligase [Eubacteriales bacterium]|nr:biotin--[acetyl-CoA-carboxylase] ligase [Eubacteriales bacterium]
MNKFNEQKLYNNTEATINSAKKIRSFLPEEEKNTEIRVFETIDSTSTYSKLYIDELMKAENEHSIVIAYEQTAGRGRQGKTFSSEKNNGIYMTLSLGVHRKMEDFLFITSACAVALVRVLKRLYLEAGIIPQESPKIKWVNDIWQGDKKVCGILTEAVNDYSKATIEYAIIGIGLNIGTDTDRLPEEVRGIAGSIGLSISDRDYIVAKLAQEVFSIAEALKADKNIAEELIKEYREESMIIGRDINWTSSGTMYEGVAVDINNEGNLLVKTDEGIIKLNSGLVSVRPKKCREEMK